MPSIQLNRTPGKPDEWETIYDYHFDKNGYLAVFSLRTPSGRLLDFYLVRNEHSLLDSAAEIFGAATSLRSGRDLLKELERHAQASGFYKAKPIHGKIAGATGMILAGAAALHEFLKTRPFKAEGYYAPDGVLVIPGSIDARSKHFRR